MAIHLEEYQELLEDLPHDAQEVLRASWHEAGRVFSSRGLDNNLKGAVALHSLGRVRAQALQQLAAVVEVGAHGMSRRGAAQK